MRAEVHDLTADVVDLELERPVLYVPVQGAARLPDRSRHRNGIVHAGLRLAAVTRASPGPSGLIHLPEIAPAGPATSVPANRTRLPASAHRPSMVSLCVDGDHVADILQRIGSLGGSVAARAWRRTAHLLGHRHQDPGKGLLARQQPRRQHLGQRIERVGRWRQGGVAAPAVQRNKREDRGVGIRPARHRLQRLGDAAVTGPAIN